MNVQQHTKHPIFTKAKAALLAGALALALLPGCAANTGAPVLTDDDLTPSSTVQDVIAGVADNGKTYPYVWYAESPELAEADYRNVWAEELEARKAEGNLTQQELDGRQAELESAIQLLQQELKDELQLDPVLSAQEAANRAGQTAEELYGLDLSQGTLYLRCTVRTTEGEQGTVRDH